MAKCVQCGSNIKDEATYCPVCGLRNPLEKKQNDDFTLTLNDLPGDVEGNDKLSFKNALILALCLGFTGVQYRYIKKPTIGIITMILSIVLFALGVVLSYVVFDLKIVFSLLIGLLTLVVINIINAAVVLLKKKEIEAK